MQRFVIAGANGFVGTALTAYLVDKGLDVVCLGRGAFNGMLSSAQYIKTSYKNDELSQHFRGADVIVNLAARVHRRGETHERFLRRYMSVNCELPVRMARLARSAGVARFVQLSSVAAVAAYTEPGEIAGDTTIPRPSTPYGMSKLAADRQLAELSVAAFTCISLRPPAVYGRGAPGPFTAVAKLARNGIALPLQKADAKRSIIYVENLASAVHGAAMNDAVGAYIVGETEPLRVCDINRQILCATDCPQPRNWFSPSILDFGTRLLLGRKAEMLIRPAAFDGSRFAKDLKWDAPVALEDAFRQSFKD